jgi:uncharacterized protein (TIGR03067 family)
MMRTLAAALILLAAAGPARAADEPKSAPAQAPTPTPNNPQNLVGNYTLVDGKTGGRAIPDAQLNGRVTITPEVMTTFDRENKEVYVLKYRVEPGEPAGRITMTVARSSQPNAVGSTARGLFRLEGEQLQIIYDYKNEAFPTSFDPKGENQNAFVLKRSAEGATK